MPCAKHIVVRGPIGHAAPHPPEHHDGDIIRVLQARVRRLVSKVHKEIQKVTGKAVTAKTMENPSAEGGERRGILEGEPVVLRAPCVREDDVGEGAEALGEREPLRYRGENPGRR